MSPSFAPMANPSIAFTVRSITASTFSPCYSQIEAELRHCSLLWKCRRAGLWACARKSVVRLLTENRARPMPAAVYRRFEISSASPQNSTVISYHLQAIFRRKGRKFPAIRWEEQRLIASMTLQHGLSRTIKRRKKMLGCRRAAICRAPRSALLIEKFAVKETPRRGFSHQLFASCNGAAGNFFFRNGDENCRYFNAYSSAEFGH